MNDSAKPANTPITDLKPNIGLEIEELEKIVAPAFNGYLYVDGVASRRLPR
jgi:hypothetical protein